MKGFDFRGVRLEDIERLCQHLRDGTTLLVLPKGWAFQSIDRTTVYSKDGAEEIGQTCTVRLSIRYDVEPPTVVPEPPAVREFDPVAEAATSPVKPPIGVMPAWLWREQHPRPTESDRRARITALRQAMDRYIAAGRGRDTGAWIEEMIDHAEVLGGIRPAPAYDDKPHAPPAEPLPADQMPPAEPEPVAPTATLEARDDTIRAALVIVYQDAVLLTLRGDPAALRPLLPAAWAAVEAEAVARRVEMGAHRRYAILEECRGDGFGPWYRPGHFAVAGQQVPYSWDASQRVVGPGWSPFFTVGGPIAPPPDGVWTLRMPKAQGAGG